jgi:hypothetical protein
MQELKSQVLDKLVVLVCKHDDRAAIRGEVIRFGDATPEIRVIDVTTEIIAPDNAAALHLSHVTIDFALNPEFEDTTIRDCATGWAETEGEAVDLATDAWMMITAPPIFSLLQSKPVLNADWLPSGNEDGIAGWDVFSSPYGLRGDEGEKERLVNHLGSQSLLPLLADEINRASKREYLNYAKLYLGFDGTQFHSDCFINGVRDEDASQKLQSLQWPSFKHFVSVSQFACLLKPVSEPET